MKKASLLFGLFYFLSFANSWGQPPTNAVTIVPDLTFYLDPEDGTRAAQIDSTRKIYSLLVEPAAMLFTNTSNYVCYRFVPFDQEFDFHLRDDKGHEVPKTTYGLSISKPVILPAPPKASDKWNEVVGLHPEIDKFKPTIGGFVIPLFRAEDVFLMTNKGVYDLTVRLRIYVPMTNGIPDSGAMRNYLSMMRSPQFGLVTSPPFHVKIVKLADSPDVSVVQVYRLSHWGMCVAAVLCITTVAILGRIIWGVFRFSRQKRLLQNRVADDSSQI